MGDFDYGHYSNLSSCRVHLVGSGAATQPPVRLPTECMEALNVPPRGDIYDFELERNVLKKAEEREYDQMLMKATSREELEKATITKLKSVTGAKEEICVAMLESNGYDLKTSIEAYVKK